MKKSLNDEIIRRCNAISNRMDKLEKSKSPVIEANERIKQLARYHIPDDDDDDYSRLLRSGICDGAADDGDDDEYSSPLNSIPGQLALYTDYERGY